MANLFDVYNDGLLIDHIEGEKLETGETPITITGLTADTTYDKVQVGYAGSYNKSDVPSFKTNLGRNYILNSERTLSGSGSVTDTDWVNTSIPVSDFSNKVITLSIQADYDNVVSENSDARLGMEIVALEVNPDGSKKNRWLGVWRYVKDGESFHGRFSTTIDLRGVTLEGINTPNHWAQGLYITNISSKNVSVSNPKLEIGNKASDWIPAPEDATS